MTIEVPSPSTYAMRVASSVLLSGALVSAWRNEATRSKVARQSAMVPKLSTNQRSDDCACVNAAAAIISPPNEILPEKYNGAATRMGATAVIQPKPAVTQV